MSEKEKIKKQYRKILALSDPEFLKLKKILSENPLPAYQQTLLNYIIELLEYTRSQGL